MKSRIAFLVAFALGLATPVAVFRTVSAQTLVNPHGDLNVDCGECHTPEGWKPVSPRPTFKHESTGFALKDAHAQAKCMACHRSLVFSRVGTACADCHRDAHKGDLGFRCEDCHDQMSWTNQRQMRERHNQTRMPLIGVHASLDCDSCHRGPYATRYALTPTSCGTCHLQTYLNAKNPDHAGRGFSRRCEDCHTLFGWRPATGVDHNTTRFPLTGSHQLASCAQCHVGGRFAGTPTDCFSCHQTRYNATSNPNHVAGNYPKTCQDCHSTTAWRPAASIDHSKTRFPLTGAHLGTDCARCHVGGRFTGTPTDCASCHQANYNATSNPNHVSASFPKTCQDCHSTTAWRPASFDHNATRFPLTGAHRNTDCARCHTSGRYSGTPTACVACHQSSYDRTTNPNHRSSGFPTDCQACHTTATWQGATFDHERYFPITSGRHRGISCATCHTNSGNYKVFSCLNGCHGKSSTDNEHKGRSGYSYDSSACYRCHPRGSGD
jgi:Cytochrome c7 and related cytochrome c